MYTPKENAKRTNYWIFGYPRFNLIQTAGYFVPWSPGACRKQRSAAVPADNESMGELIHLSERMADRTRAGSSDPRFFFALDDPISYLAAEQVERALGPIEWIPVLGASPEQARRVGCDERERRARERMRLAEREARVLHLPLVEPHRLPMDSRKAARAAAFAADRGAGAAFGLALLRLAFCGGFDIASAPVIQDAAAVAGLNPDEAGAAARDRRLDLRLDATSRGLRMRGISSPPAIGIGQSWLDGSDVVSAAVSYTAARARAEPRAPLR